MSTSMMQKNGGTNTLSNHRISSLNGLKALGVFAIFIWHSPLPSPPVDLGARGVECLFILTGFLVAFTYWDNPMPCTWHSSLTYYKKKILQIWPAHFFAFIIVAIWLQKIEWNSLGLARAILNLSLLQAWSFNTYTHFSFNSLSWYSSALLFSYFLTPAFLQIVLKQKNQLFVF